MTNMALSATGQLNSKKNWKHKIFQYRGWIISLAILIATIFIGYSIYAHRSSSHASIAATQIDEYIQGPLANYNQKKISAEKLIMELKALLGTIDYHPVAAATLLETSDVLSQTKKHQKSLEILKIADEQFSKKASLISYLILSRQAVVYEDLSQKEEAIAILNRMSNSHIKFMEDKIHLDLGRLYYEMENLQKARLNFNYVIANSKENDFINLARIYLDKLDGK